MFLNIQIDLLILKTYYGQFTLTTKKSLHIIFKESYMWTPVLFVIMTTINLNEYTIVCEDGNIA